MSAAIRSLMLLTLLYPVLAAADKDMELLRDELQNAMKRQQQELSVRADDLSAQILTAEELLELQQRYIEQLETHIRALQKPQDD
ncbi:MAG: hypothetical protein CVV10_05640 [Gammaproteobacteria bacterium HGW-Gammaproteobacteria-14]|nr:MAG: hypothetical protein CVV10_05640 [Gammaproteobacteria bacterium HGW-Gammaproteobacteria-14]